MPATFTTTGANTTIAMSWTQPTQVIVDVVGNAAHELHKQGYGPVDASGNQIVWEALSNQQKLNIVYTFTQNAIVNQARHYYIRSAAEAAELAAAAGAQGLGL